MAQEYASKQPRGFNNFIKNVAIVGAGGNVGKYIVEQLLKTGKHKVTAISRIDSTSKIPEGAEVKKVDYNDSQSLVNAFQGQDALIITMGVMAPPGETSKLIEAAAAANVPWILPNEFGADPTNEELQKDVFLGAAKAEDREQIERLGKSSWIGVVCGFWYEYSLSHGPFTYGFDFKNQSVELYNDGSTKILTTTFPQVGRAVAKLLSLKILPEDENDKSVSLESFKNNFCFVSSFKVSQKDMLDSVLRVTGTNLNDWKVDYEPVVDRYQSGLAEFKKGNMLGFGKLLYARSFYPDNDTFDDTKGLHNTVLDLPKEDLDECTRRSMKMVEEGIFS